MRKHQDGTNTYRGTWQFISPTCGACRSGSVFLCELKINKESTAELPVFLGERRSISEAYHWGAGALIVILVLTTNLSVTGHTSGHFLFGVFFFLKASNVFISTYPLLFHSEFLLQCGLDIFPQRSDNNCNENSHQSKTPLLARPYNNSIPIDSVGRRRYFEMV